MKPSKLVLTLGLALGLTSAALAQQITMRNAISVAQNSHAGEAIDTLAREVERRTNGRIVIDHANSMSTVYNSDRILGLLKTRGLHTVTLKQVFH